MKKLRSARRSPSLRPKDSETKAAPTKGGHDAGEAGVIPGRLVEVEVERLAPGGDAVGREVGPPDSPSRGRVVFVPGAAPGDRLLARLTREKERLAWGELAHLRVPSPLRQEAGCAVFGQCGGCQWRHVTIAAQRDAKRAIVARALGVPEVPLVSPLPADGYRERARLHAGRGGGGLGFHARRAHELVVVKTCPQLAPELSGVVQALRASAATAVLVGAGAALADATWDLQKGGEGIQVAVTLAGAALPKSEAAHLAAHLLEALRPAGVVGVRLGEALAGLADVDVAEPGSAPLRLPAGAFAQVSSAAHGALAAAVRDAVGLAPGVVVELYAGSGNFTRHLLDVATQVVASDGDAAAVARGRHNAPKARWSVAPPRDVVPDTVVLDPPRAGTDEAHLAAALRARHRIVYVSCDPQTLGRDAARLRAAGFVLRRAVALDLMPQTFHVETVAVFDREGRVGLVAP